MEAHHHNNARIYFGLLVVVIRLALGCLFLWSATSKIRLPHEFLGNVYDYQLLGPVQGVLLAAVLPWLELIVGICLLGDIFVTGALLACMAMASMFIVAISWALYNHLNISCGCFGSGNTPQIDNVTLIRALIIFMVSALAYGADVFGWSSARELRLDPEVPPDYPNTITVCPDVKTGMSAPAN